MTGFDGKPVNKGAFIVNLVLMQRPTASSHGKSCGRERLSTWHLWQGHGRAGAGTRPTHWEQIIICPRPKRTRYGLK